VTYADSREINLKAKDEKAPGFSVAVQVKRFIHPAFQGFVKHQVEPM
jgi:hypothetical protein